MNKDELKEKGENLKERAKEGFGDAKKKADGFMDKMRQNGRDKSDPVKQDVPKRDVPQDEDDE
jgi:hypothetical protein